MEGLFINCKLSYTKDRAKEELDTVTLFLPLIFIVPTLNSAQIQQNKIIVFDIKIQTKFTYLTLLPSKLLHLGPIYM